MTVKTISIMKDIYERLSDLKAPGEDFSDEIRLLIENKHGIMEFAGAWGDIDEKEARDIKKYLKSIKKKN